MKTWYERWRELEKGATEGPWKPRIWYAPSGTCWRIDYGTDSIYEENAQLIAFLRNTAAEVAAVVREARHVPDAAAVGRLFDALDALDRRVKELLQE